jgi:hypothetical protein
VNEPAPALLIPIAHYIGETYDTVDKTTTYDLRGGWNVVHITKDERVVWGLAHGTADAVREGQPWTRARLLDVVGSAVPNAENIVESLLQKDILAEVVPGTKGAIEFAKEYRLVPLQLGLGNTQDEPWLWRIGPGEPLVAVPGRVYHIWTWGHLYRSLWGACKALSKIDESDDEGIVKAEENTPEAILSEVLEMVHLLLAAGCAYFDVYYKWGAE